MKNFILDTNVLLHDPQSLFKFQDNNIIIPITVIEEVDRFKKDMKQAGMPGWFQEFLIQCVRKVPWQPV
jgi:predicted ribonuclease YlaK